MKYEQIKNILLTNGYTTQDYKNEILRYIDKIQQENKQLKANYERLYNENCKLRERHNINDISLLDENYRLETNLNKLKENANKALKKIDNMFNEGNDNTIIDDLLELERILEGSDSNE